MSAETQLVALVAGDTTALHPDVVLERGDGVRFEGRAAVLAMFQEAHEAVRYTVVAQHEGRIVVALMVAGVAGGVHFALEGEVVDGLLVHVRVVAP